MASHGCTMVLFLSTGLLEDVEQELAAGGYAPDTPAAIVYKATWTEQRVYRCTVSTLARTARENRVTKTALITIGHFLGMITSGQSSTTPPLPTSSGRPASDHGGHRLYPPGGGAGPQPGGRPGR